MNTGQLTATSQILIISTGYNSSGFLGGLNSILNQLLYAEALGFIPVVHFNPWSDEFPDFNRQELFQNNQWPHFFEAIEQYSYEDILKFIESADHPLTRRNLHYLSNEEMLYLDFGNPESIYSGFYGYYKFYKGNRQEWLIAQRRKAAALMNRYIKLRPDHDLQADTDFQHLSQGAPTLGVVIDCFERLEAHHGVQSSQKLYFSLIDEYVKDNPKCRILLATENKRHQKVFKKRYGSRLKVLLGKTEKFSRFNQWLALSKCDFLLKDHSDLSEFVLYFNSDLNFKDVRDQLRSRSFNRLKEETELFRRRWATTMKEEGLSVKTVARLTILGNPGTQMIVKGLERYRYSRSNTLRWSVLFIDSIKLLRARAYFPIRRIKHRAFHATNNIGAGFYRFEDAPKKKYFEIRNAWDTNTGFFAYFMFALQQLKFTEIHRLKPVVNFNEPHNYFYEAGYSSNIWENYFEPVDDLSANDLSQLDSEEVTFIDHKYHDRPGNAADPPQANELSTKIWMETHRAMKAALTKKYIKPKAFMLDMVDQFYAEHMNDQFVLGIQIRGTDKDVDQKGNRYVYQEELVRKIGPDEYYPYVDKYLLNSPKAKIFVATDQQQYLDSFTKRYAERIITSAAMRTKGDEPIFRLSEGSKFQRGVEVMFDCLLLSRCDCLIKGSSNVGEAAICFNPAITVVDIMHLPDINGIDFTKPKPAVSENLLQLHECLIESNQSGPYQKAVNCPDRKLNVTDG